MMEQRTVNRFTWKRSLIGGLISALIAGVCFGLYIYGPRVSTAGAISFLLLGFGFLGLVNNNWGTIGLTLTVIFWFLVGGGINYFIRKNSIAIAVWLIVYAISFAISLALFADMMN